MTILERSGAQEVGAVAQDGGEESRRDLQEGVGGFSGEGHAGRENGRKWEDAIWWQIKTVHFGSIWKPRVSLLISGFKHKELTAAAAVRILSRSRNILLLESVLCLMIKKERIFLSSMDWDMQEKMESLHKITLNSLVKLSKDRKVLKVNVFVSNYNSEKQIKLYEFWLVARRLWTTKRCWFCGGFLSKCRYGIIHPNDFWSYFMFEF